MTLILITFTVIYLSTYLLFFFKGDTSGSSNILVLSYPAYCRNRSTLKRLEGHNQTDYMRQAVVEAIGGRAAPSPNTRVVFCKDTFDYPELEDHELLCNHLGN